MIETLCSIVSEGIGKAFLEFQRHSFAPDAFAINCF
jgi:hypothetical protein